MYVDTSSTLSFIGEREAKKFISFFGAEWFLFGSDYPIWSPKADLGLFMQLDLTDAEREMILSKNAERVYKITN